MAPDHAAAVGVLIDCIVERGGRDAIAAVGHRVVHGGQKYSKPQRITPEMIKELHGLSPFDPEHLPEEILLIEAVHRRFPNLPQVACFDTAFHHDLPRVARILPIPRRYEAKGVRRYGFHGLSYAFLMKNLPAWTVRKPREAGSFLPISAMAPASRRCMMGNRSTRVWVLPRPQACRWALVPGISILGWSAISRERNR